PRLRPLHQRFHATSGVHTTCPIGALAPISTVLSVRGESRLIPPLVRPISLRSSTHAAATTPCFEEVPMFTVSHGTRTLSALLPAVVLAIAALALPGPATGALALRDCTNAAWSDYNSCLME